MIQILQYQSKFCIVSKYDPDVISCIKGMPQRRWIKAKKSWSFDPILVNFQYLDKWFPTADWCQEATDKYNDLLGNEEVRESTLQAKESESFDLSPLDGVPFKYPPFAHQGKALLLGRDCETFAYFMDQGTGKTKVLLDDIAHNYRLGRIDAAIIVCPNGVKTNYVDYTWMDLFPDAPDQIDRHMAPDINYEKAILYATAPRKFESAKFSHFISQASMDLETLFILVVNVEALGVRRVENTLNDFARMRRCLIAVDESTKIKTSTANRSKAAMRIRKECKFARILTGTPVIKRPLDAYGQLTFLDPNILGHSSFYAFRNEYANMGGFEGKQVLSYKNLDKLEARLASCSFRIQKDDCLDLPPKMYETRYVEMNPAQIKAYKAMKEESLVIINNLEISATIKLTQLLKFQQITSGYLLHEDEFGNKKAIRLSGVPPKMSDAISIIEECQHKVLVWARFKAEAYDLYNNLIKKGYKVALYTGEQTDAEKLHNRKAFQDKNNELQILIGSAAAGGMGIDLYQASTVIYLSNSFNTEDRIQSEDRAHRQGLDHPVQYIDLICKGTVDEKIVETLRSDVEISSRLMKDNLKSWI